MYIDERNLCSSGLTTSPEDLEEIHPSSAGYAHLFQNTGLYIKSRSNQIIRVSIPKDCLAFQMGEALQCLSGGSLKATAHCVRGIEKGTDAQFVARNTFAVFMQPNLFEVVDPSSVENRRTFAEFTKEVLKRHF